MPLKPYFYHAGKLSIRGRLALVSLLIVTLTASAVIVNSFTLGRLEQSLQSTRADVASRHDTLTMLQEHMGYGGAIHHFKNYVLRGKKQDAQLALDGFTHAANLIENYHRFTLSSDEKKALLAISGTLKQYQEHLELEDLKHFDLANISSNDRLVKVDDTLALRGFQLLQQELEMLRSKHRLDSDLYLERSINTVLAAGVLIFLVCVVGLLWVYRSIVGRINVFADYSQKLKHSPHLTDETIDWDEFGDIAKNYQEVIGLLEQEKEKAEQSNRSKSAFLATVSHEIRTPMNGVLGLAQLLAKSELTTEQRGHLIHLMESGEHMMALLDEVLDYSKIEEGKLDLDMSEFAFSSIIGTLQSLYYPLAEQKGLQFYINSDVDEQRWYKSDKRHLRQMLYNLVNNAIKFTPHGCVEVNFQEWVKEGRTELHVEVRDTGVGIDIETQQRIFEPFEQADGSTTRNYGGTGLGLAIVRRLAKMMSGDVAVSSVPGAGSRFTLTLELESIEPKASEITSVKTMDYSGLEVLLVEDNQVNILVLENVLEQMGFKVTVATRGKYAVDLARRNAYNLILMDHHMPEMSGLEATRLIRQISLNEKTVILGCTADVFAETKAKMISAGVDSVVAKPLDQREFHETIATYSSRIFVESDKRQRSNERVAHVKRLPPKNIMLKTESEFSFDFLEDINVADIARSLSISKELFPTFASTIINDSSNQLEALEKALQREDTDRILLHAHTLKGTWRSLAIWPMVRMAERIQNEVKQERLQPETVARFKKANIATLDHLQTLFDHREIS
ncbi:response regulator [Vibrio sp. RE86]|uniref:hybrid sensor histidine kinase/response regulator n=1 Tax=Vibrio sp. RE86 TaxID=2607605 RepID=UPI001493CBEB|nr:ATP-binding protein [Vibrio sp. RE86]NOH81252.1 response regulator [Vibrio sp. RE86]